MEAVWAESIQFAWHKPVIETVVTGYNSEAIVSRDARYEPSKVIVRTEGICGGSPRIDGTRIPVRLIASLYWQGETISNIASTYDVTPWQVRQAVDYASQHRQEIEDAIRMDELA